jgi:hypothetical protein
MLAIPISKFPRILFPPPSLRRRFKLSLVSTDAAMHAVSLHPPTVSRAFE